MKKKQYVAISNDDLVWIANKILQDYAEIKNSNEDEVDKNAKISALVFRARDFELNEVVNQLGYEIHEIPFKGKESGVLIMPKKLTENDLLIIRNRIELLGQSLKDDNE